jgi:tRNA(Ile)-lysidine synthase
MRPVRTLDEKGEFEKDGGAGPEDEPLLVRPFLTWAFREDTVRYATECGVTPREDAMNDDLSFSRVRVRKELIPLLMEFNPNIVASLAKTADSAADGIELLTADPGELVAAAEILRNEKIRVAELLKLSTAARYLVIRKWLEKLRGDIKGIEKGHIEAVVSLAASGKSGKTAELPRFGSVVKSGGRLVFQKRKVEK